MAGSLQVDPLLMSGRPAQQSRLAVVVVALLRISTLLAATYLGGNTLCGIVHLSSVPSFHN